MFLGEFNYTIDKKRRMNIPACFRKVLDPEAKETFVICRAPNSCLRAYPINIWKVYENKLKKLPQTPNTLRHLRLLRSTLTDSTLDTQGRIMLSAKQVVIAGITKNVTLVGNNEYIEIWDSDRYNEHIGTGDDFDEMFFQSVEAGFRVHDDDAQ